MRKSGRKLPVRCQATNDPVNNAMLVILAGFGCPPREWLSIATRGAVRGSTAAGRLVVGARPCDRQDRHYRSHSELDETSSPAVPGSSCRSGCSRATSGGCSSRRCRAVFLACRRAAQRAALTSRHGPRRRQTAIDRGGADRRHELLAHARVQGQVPVPLECRHQDRQQRLQALAAHAVRRLPKDDQSLGHGLVVHAPASPPPRASPRFRSGLEWRACGGTR